MCSLCVWIYSSKNQILIPDDEYEASILLLNVRRYKQSQAFSTASVKTAQYLMPSYFCRALMRLLTLFLDSDISGASKPSNLHTTHTTPLLCHCNGWHEHAKCNSCQFLWWSSKAAATGYDPWHVPDGSPGKWRDKLWRNSKPSHSAAGHLSATQRTSYLSHFQVPFDSHSWACMWKMSLKFNIKFMKIFLFNNSGFTATLMLQRGCCWYKMLQHCSCLFTSGWTV